MANYRQQDRYDVGAVSFPESDQVVPCFILGHDDPDVRVWALLQDMPELAQQAMHGEYAVIVSVPSEFVRHRVGILQASDRFAQRFNERLSAFGVSCTVRLSRFAPMHDLVTDKLGEVRIVVQTTPEAAPKLSTESLGMFTPESVSHGLPTSGAWTAVTIVYPVDGNERVMTEYQASIPFSWIADPQNHDDEIKTLVDDFRAFDLVVFDDLP